MQWGSKLGANNIDDHAASTRQRPRGTKVPLDINGPSPWKRASRVLPSPAVLYAPDACHDSDGLERRCGLSFSHPHRALPYANIIPRLPGQHREETGVDEPVAARHPWPADRVPKAA